MEHLTTILLRDAVTALWSSNATGESLSTLTKRAVACGMALLAPYSANTWFGGGGGGDGGGARGVNGGGGRTGGVGGGAEGNAVRAVRGGGADGGGGVGGGSCGGIANGHTVPWQMLDVQNSLSEHLLSKVDISAVALEHHLALNSLGQPHST